jgi:subtilase family serine protease
MRLEDRVVPGETTGASMPWAAGILPYASLLARDAAQQRIDGASASPDRSAFLVASADDDSASISISPARVDENGPVNYETPSNDTIVSDSMFSDDLAMGGFDGPARATPASGGSFSLMNEHVLGNSGANVTAPFGNSAPAFTPAASSNSAALENLFMDVAAMDAQAGSTAGDVSPLLIARSVAAPGHVRHNAGLVYDPTQIRHAYGFDQVSNKGAGQTIYIVDAYNDPNITNDLHVFDSQWGLSNPNFTVHKMSRRIANSTSWGLEESLDVEWAHAIAPQANITLVEATSASNSALFSAINWATTNGAHIVSMSWGGGDSSGNNSFDSYFNHTGVSYVASAGDTGGVVEYPSASPYVLSVGGTSLPLDANGNRTGAETAWSSGGGGASIAESEPTYQKNYGISLSGRGTPDVSYDADPNTGVYVYDTYLLQPGWYQVGGTSAGAPQWAALIALVNQSRSTPLSTNNLASRTEYNAATGSVYSSNYTDITSGSNGYPAGPGYDLATGVGSPLANNLVSWMINNS